MMTEEEYIKIKKYLSKDKQGRAAFTQALNVLRKYKGTGIVYLMCPFSNKSKKCSIYSMRPEICREFHCTPSLQGPNYGKDKYGTNPRTIGDFFKGRV
jgi:Fe-S-cluster containining protein